jgi:predicted Zn-dependent peptidase
MRVVTDAMPLLKSASLGVWVNVGARFENEPNQGISHLLEHMAFKGTKRRTAKQIAEEIEAVGGYLNAYTGREQTAYYARVLKDNVPLAVDIIADILQHSTFDKEELAREKGVVVQEIGQAEDTPDDIIFDHLQSVAYPDQPLGRAILGTVKSVNSFTRKSLTSYMDKWYGGRSMTFIAAGAIDHDQLVRLVAEKFSALNGVNGSSAKAAHYGGGEFRKTDDLEQAHLTIAIPGPRVNDPEIFAAQVFTAVLGGGMSSRLFQEVREKRGLCYSIYAFSSHYRDGGLFGIYAGTGAKHLTEIVPVITGEIEAISTKATEAEVSRARAQLKAGLLMSLESPTSRCEQIAAHLFAYGRVLTPDEIIKKLDTIDVRAVKRVAEGVLKSGRPSVAALGPVKRLESYDRLAARFG